MKELKDAVNTLYDYQKLRIALENRIRAGNYTSNETPIFVNQAKRFYELENEMEKFVGDLIKDIPIWKEFLSGVKGVGPRIAGILISEIDIYKATTVSKLWAYAGLSVVDGRAPRRVKGQKLGYNSWLRTTLVGKLANSFLMVGSPYSKFYYDYKNRIDNMKEHQDKSKLWRMRMAKRYMVKMFTKDLQIKWSKIEGLPVRESYQVEYLGHKN